jgi:hypothetical protein
MEFVSDTVCFSFNRCSRDEIDRMRHVIRYEIMLLSVQRILIPFTYKAPAR